ncbi:hypothetical protein CXF68_15000 [Tenacibaculum sp. Bg11-29]|uniref:hypothetical protein n=1 Tax=Tenacibaculum sp. Bg11-29 TaxID=2058306 RepID=UPI000C31D723|nr:hypothetical protein [Tenacibaculum sp. Bg11-29]PKH51915.1 hypothetical protein CXF68_15000 [Tenacibaculum sp. Bg11-29]
MKTKFDLNDPIFKIAIKIHEDETELALNIEKNIQKAVIPIAFIPKTKAHQIKKRKPEQVGSGVLVKIKKHFFIFSATHVFNGFESETIYTGSPENNFIEPLTGERFTTGNKEEQIDMHDATVFHIKNNISQGLKKIAITFNDMDKSIVEDINIRPIFIATGFRNKDSNLSKNELTARISTYPSVEIPDYIQYGYKAETQLVISHENQILMDKKWKTSPIPRGMSGGAIIKAQGTSTHPFYRDKIRKEKKQLLSAIIIEHYKDNNDKLGHLVSTRINVHLGLILKYMPEIFRD